MCAALHDITRVVHAASGRSAARGACRTPGRGPPRLGSGTRPGRSPQQRPPTFRCALQAQTPLTAHTTRPPLCIARTGRRPRTGYAPARVTTRRKLPAHAAAAKATGGHAPRRPAVASESGRPWWLLRARAPMTRCARSETHAVALLPPTAPLQPAVCSARQVCFASVQHTVAASRAIMFVLARRRCSGRTGGRRRNTLTGPPPRAPLTTRHAAPPPAPRRSTRPNASSQARRGCTLRASERAGCARAPPLPLPPQAAPPLRGPRACARRCHPARASPLAAACRARAPSVAAKRRRRRAARPVTARARGRAAAGRTMRLWRRWSVEACLGATCDAAPAWLLCVVDLEAKKV